MLLGHVYLVVFLKADPVQPIVLWGRSSVTHISVQKILAEVQAKLYY